MKIGLVSPFSFSYFGGVQKHILALAKELKSLGHEAKILVPRRDVHENYGPDILLLGYSFPFPANASRIDVSWGLPWETEKVLRKEKFDLLHFHGLSPVLGWQIFEAGKKMGTTNVYTAHSNFDRSGLAQNFPQVTETYFDFIKKNFDGVIGVSRVAAKALKDYHGPKVNIPNGVDLQRFRPDISPIGKYNDGKINLLFVGRLDERKGVLVLLKAFQKILQKRSNVRLLMIGEGPLESEARRFIGKCKLSNVELLGKVAEADLPHYYKTAHIFCAPSLGGESFGMVLLEAMACGTPVVGSRIEGYKEVLKGLGSQLLFKTNDVVDLARILTNLVESEELRQRYSRWGLEEVKKYSWPKVAAKVSAFYERVRKTA